MVIEWRSPPGFSAYEVSEYGAVRRISDYNQYKKGHVLKPCKNPKGYVYYQLRPDDPHLVVKANGSRNVRIHKVVNEIFNGPPPSPEHMSCHRDDNKGNNHYSNLYWGTALDNSRDATKNNIKGRGFGGNSGRARLTDHDACMVRKFREAGWSINGLCKKYSVGRSVIERIIKRKTYKHSKCQRILLKSL